MIEQNNKTTDQGIEYLRKIGVEKIKEDTHLDSNKIADILEKRFDRLDYVRAKGFIYILEKEYHLDLSDWLEEYHLAHPPMDDEEQEKREHYSNEVKQKKIVFSLCLIGACIALFVLGQMFFRSNFVFWGSKRQAERAPEVQTENQMKNPEEHQENKAEPLAPSKEDQSLEKEEQIPKKEEEKKTEARLLKPMSELGNPVFDEMMPDSDSILSLEFSKPVWVGVVDLDSKKRTAKISKEFEIPLDHESLIYIAYGSFIASLDGEEKEFKTYKPIFLTYSVEGGLREIEKDEFVILNGGIEW